MRSTLNRLISPKSKLALRHEVLLYKAIFRPIMLYASPIWAGAAVTHLKRLHTFQSIQLRRAANAPCLVIKEIYPFSPRSIEMWQTIERRALLSWRCDVIFSSFPMKAKQKLNQLGEWLPTHPSTSVVALHLMWTAIYFYT
ncbi:hypothetical protein TNCV_897671 [Trichonephila clavipes]|nr:hypothetical protein TNCV_897671 [Trichonephila clavipes]